MNETTGGQNQSSTRQSAKRAIRFGLVAALLVAGGVIATSFVDSSLAGTGWMGPHRQHWDDDHWHDISNVEQAQQQARTMAAWLSGTIDADTTQATRLEAILVELSGELFPLRDAHRAHELQLITELSRDQLDRDAIEQLRLDALSLADRATTEVSEALFAAAAVLDAQQRQRLTALVAKHGHRYH